MLPKLPLLLLLAVLGTPWCFADPVAVLCGKSFDITQDSDTLQALYCADDDIDLSSDTVDDTKTAAIVLIHGDARDADEYLAYVQQARIDSGNPDTVIVAPQFVIDEDIEEFDLQDSATLYWSSVGWRKGNTSNKSPFNRPFTISSFAVVDQMMMQIMVQFPNAKITVAGHSAGGQFVHRYAAGGLPADKYIVANPSSYLYFTDERAALSGEFSIPDASTHVFGASDCPDYDDFMYGLKALNTYMKSVGKSALLDNFKSRNTIVYLGTDDTRRNSPFDDTCMADLQGSNRYERGLTFYSHAKHALDKEMPVKIAPGVAHNAQDMFQHACGLALLFDYNTAACPDYEPRQCQAGKVDCNQDGVTCCPDETCDKFGKGNNRYYQCVLL